MWKRWQAITLWKRILGALLLGAVLGAAFKAAGLEAFGAALEPVGKLFINAIKMLMVPIVFVTIVAGVTAL
ncbi:MAG: dicarboxylate/amino acid:cation symporter, partial [Alphaproteobacteria bacterium]